MTLPERFVEMRERHTRMNGVGEQYDDGGISSCHWCDELWPCSFVQLFDAIESLTTENTNLKARLAEAEKALGRIDNDIEDAPSRPEPAFLQRMQAIARNAIAAIRATKPEGE